MNLGDQLKELRFNVLRDRSDLISGDTDSLWDDDTLLLYIGQSERRFARQTLLLRDGTSAEFCKLVLRLGIRDYPMRPEVLAVISARLTGQDLDMRRSGHALVQPVVPSEVQLPIDPGYFTALPPGTPLAYYTDETLIYGGEGGVTVSIYPLPDASVAGQVVNLRVVRLPKGAYTTADLGEDSELPEDYQLDVLEWAAYLAQRGNDNDSGATTSSEAHKASFEAAVKAAIRETKRKMFAVTGVRYGGQGFAWTR